MSEVSTPSAATFAVQAGKDVAHIVPAGTEPTELPQETVTAGCGTKLSPTHVLEDDARAERVSGKRVCRNCRSAAAREAAKPVAEKPAKKSNGSKPKPAKKSASIEPLSKTETKKLVELLDSLSSKRDKYVEDRAAGKPVEKRRNRSAYAEYEAAYSRIRRSGQTVREARAVVAK